MYGVVSSCDKYEDTWYPFFKIQIETYQAACKSLDLNIPAHIRWHRMLFRDHSVVKRRKYQTNRDTDILK